MSGPLFVPSCALPRERGAECHGQPVRLSSRLVQRRSAWIRNTFPGTMVTDCDRNQTIDFRFRRIPRRTTMDDQVSDDRRVAIAGAPSDSSDAEADDAGTQ